jgi:hypothetical protein
LIACRARPAPAATWLDRGMPPLKSGCPSRTPPATTGPPFDHHRDRPAQGLGHRGRPGRPRARPGRATPAHQRRHRPAAAGLRRPLAGALVGGGGRHRPWPPHRPAAAGRRRDRRGRARQALCPCTAAGHRQRPQDRPGRCGLGGSGGDPQPAATPAQHRHPRRRRGAAVADPTPRRPGRRAHPRLEPPPRAAARPAPRRRPTPTERHRRRRAAAPDPPDHRGRHPTQADRPARARRRAPPGPPGRYRHPGDPQGRHPKRHHPHPDLRCRPGPGRQDPRPQRRCGPLPQP